MSDLVVIQQTPTEARIRGLLEPIVTHRGCELVHVKVVAGTGVAKLCLYIDRLGIESGVTIDDLEAVNRLIGDVLDVADASEPLFKGSYDLEVSSPGLDRPLAKRQHFENAIGKLIRIKTAGQLGLPKNVNVLLKSVSDEGIEVEWEQKKEALVGVPWFNLQEANIVYVFGDIKKPKKK